MHPMKELASNVPRSMPRPRLRGWWVAVSFLVLPLLYLFAAWFFRGSIAVRPSGVVEELAKSLIAISLIVVTGVRDIVRDNWWLQETSTSCKAVIASIWSTNATRFAAGDSPTWIDTRKIAIDSVQAASQSNERSSTWVLENKAMALSALEHVAKQDARVQARLTTISSSMRSIVLAAERHASSPSAESINSFALALAAAHELFMPSTE
ncbi:MAG: hypothetical protein U0163_20905 [Gemmatimonadaceae bacterium]